MYYGDYGMGGGFGWWITMAIMMIAFWGGIVWFAVSVIRRPNHTSHPGGPDPIAASSTSNVSRKSAQEILEIRLARGEIELDDYRQRLNALQSSKE